MKKYSDTKSPDAVIPHKFNLVDFVWRPGLFLFSPIYTLYNNFNLDVRNQHKKIKNDPILGKLVEKNTPVLGKIDVIGQNIADLHCLFRQCRYSETKQEFTPIGINSEYQIPAKAGLLNINNQITL